MQNLLGEKQIVKTEGGEYGIWRRRAKGPLVILLHGWPVTSYHWRYLIPSLASSGFETMAIDLKGFGESKTRDSIFDKVSLARDLCSVVSFLKGEHTSFHLIGHDWGGSVAIAMAALFPRRVASLVVEEEIAPGLEVPLLGESALYYPTWHGGFHRSQLSESLISGREEQYVNFFLDLRYEPSSLSPIDRKKYLNCYLTPEKTATAMAYYRTYSRDASFYRSLLNAKLEIPCLAFSGGRGMGEAVLKSLLQIAPHSKGFIFEKSGHYPAEEQPERFSTEVLRFLSLLSNPKSKQERMSRTRTGMTTRKLTKGQR